MLIGLGSVPSSGRPACETTRATSGILRSSSAHVVQRPIDFTGRDAGRQREIHPDAALIEFRKKLRPSAGPAMRRRDQGHRRYQQHYPGPRRAPASAPAGRRMRVAHDDVLLLLFASSQQVDASSGTSVSENSSDPTSAE